MTDGTRSGWDAIAEHDDAAALVAALLDLDPAATYTRTELSDATGVPYRTLYLEGTLEAAVDLGLVEKRDREDDEPVYALATDSDVLAAARAFDAATAE
ncbi:hypothetical protein [Halomicrobium salinisoli]|uniref:hypothetical protein n=1 Tax=Halomicrobium salinisoli TaxID=2878391 RepID=UPI001CEFE75E|nr:hypothetical protein [Halomicrobium salinisoli]